MEELKLLLELGPNLTAGGLEAFGYYVISKTLGSVAIAGVLLTAIILFYKAYMYEARKDERARAGDFR